MGASLIASRYRLGDVLGRGGMGEVYRAVDTTNGRAVAVKVMSADRAGSPEKVREWEVRFDREVQAIGGVRSPHVVQILDAGIDSETRARYLVMELLEGEDLARVIKRVGPLPVDVALRIAAQICMGLAQAHAQGIVHRDIKPGNVFLGAHDGLRTARILDFGVARLTGGEEAELTDVTRTGSMIGSPQYMSPEQARGSKMVDLRADIWSVGVVLYRMLTGTLPHEMGTDGGFGELLISICFAPAPAVQSRAPWVPPAVAQIVHRALSIPKEARFQSAHEMATALLALVPGASTEVTEVSLVPVAESTRRQIAPKAEIPSGTAPEQSHSNLITDAAMARPIGPLPRNGKLGMMLVGMGFLGVSALATGLVLWNARAHAGATVAPPPIATTPPASATPSAPPPPVVPQDLTVSVTVPSNAIAEVDGVRTPVSGGHVPVTGAPGTTHVVKLTAGKQSKSTSVFITAEGQAQPPTIALAAGKAGVEKDKPTAAPPSKADTSTTDSRF